MICRYRLHLDDFKAAQRLHARCIRRARLLFLLCHRILPLAGAAAFALLLWDIFLRHFAFAPGLGALLGGIAWLGLYTPLARRLALRRSFRRLMERTGGTDQPLELELRENELISRIPGHSEGRFLPTAIQDMVRDERICLIYIGKKVFLFIPREALPEDLWGAIAAWSGKAREC